MSLENQIYKLIALKQTAPPLPTLLEKPKSVEEDLGGGASNLLCGVSIPLRYHSLVQQIYIDMINFMYCRPNPIPGGGCDQLSLGPPLGEGSLPPEQWVTDRDKPLSWQRMHPDFDPDDPATWGSLFGPGGFADKDLRFFLAYMGDDGQYGTGPLRPGVTQADIDAQIDLIRQLYSARCSFATAVLGACCSPAGDFEGFSCTEVSSASMCVGQFYSGQNCGQINC